jgi:hypothetical protein
VAAAAAAAAPAAGAKRKRPAGDGAAGVLAAAGELWGDEEYEEEYELQGFLDTLRPE